MTQMNLDNSRELESHLREEIRRISHTHRRGRVLRSRIMLTLCVVALAITAVPLLMLIWELLHRGIPILKASFFTQLPQTPDLIHPQAVGGVSNAIIGTLALNLYAAILAVPLGILVGIYVAESDSKLASIIRVTSQTMAGAPSILMGLFAFAVFLQYLKIGFSAIAGSFGLAVLMLPVIVLSTEIAVRGVPHTYKEAGLALGAKPHTVSLRVILPAAVTGIVTGTILAVSRAIGETAPLLLVIGGGFTNAWKPLSPVSALPLSIYMNAKSQWPAQRAQVWGVALVLVAFVFVLSLTARMWASRKKQG